MAKWQRHLKSTHSLTHFHLQQLIRIARHVCTFKVILAPGSTHGSLVKVLRQEHVPLVHPCPGNACLSANSKVQPESDSLALVVAVAESNAICTTHAHKRRCCCCSERS
jgi:hypothetical protein